MPARPFKRSEAWAHFLIDPNEQKVATCRHCKKCISFAGGSTSNLSRHLKKKHPSLAPSPYGFLTKSESVIEDDSVQETILLELEEEMQEGEKVDEQRERARYSQSPKAHRGPTSLHRALLKLDELASFDRDEFSLFGTYVTNQLKKLPLESALRCQQEIQGILTRERLNALRCNTETSYYYIAQTDSHDVHPTTTTTPIIETLQLPVDHRDIVIQSSSQDVQEEHIISEVHTEE